MVWQFTSTRGTLSVQQHFCRDVRIRNNSLSGWLPNDMCNNMPNIKALVLSHNQIGGQIPPNIWKCKRLETLSLSYNNFNGNIPREIGRLRVLRELYLGYVNGFQGGIPIEIGNLSRLEILHIDHASLTGDIPSSIFNISSLRVLSLVYNNLSVVDGISPPGTSNLSSGIALRRLSLTIGAFILELMAEVNLPSWSEIS
ncbi:leucine-rich repeat receptor-like kinase protein SUNN isoform X2 [Salvia splendens]|nr:leucine-rich repeat receptor-like kinase protein SUNN isoform X2 [Salvia splendens]